MRSGRFLTLALATCALAAQASAAPSELPLLYQIDSPLYEDKKDWTVTVYQTDDFSVAAHTPAGESAVVDSEDGTATLEGQGPMYAAGARTDRRLAKGQRLSRHYFRIEQGQPPEPGKHYTETVDPPGPRSEPYQREWWIDDFSLSWERGDDDREVAGLATRHYVLTVEYDYHRIDSDDGERTDETVASERHFWFAEALPFSPLQMLPLQIINDYRYVCFCSPGGGQVNELVDARLAEKLQNAGMLMRTAFEQSGESFAIEVSDIREQPDLQVNKYRQWPVIPASREGTAVGGLIVHEMLARAGGGDAGEARITPTDAGTLQASSAFKINDTGDFALANILRMEDGSRGMFLFLRPYHGLPEPGTYTTKPRPERADLRGLDLAALKERARHFQVVGVIERDDALTIYTSTGEGRIEIADSSSQTVTGEFTLEMEAIDAFGDGRLETVPVTGEFTAQKGLDKVRMRSNLGRMIERQE